MPRPKGEAERHANGDQMRLRAIMEIPFQRLPFLRLRFGDAPP